MRPSENEQRGLRFGIFCISVVLAIAAIFGMKAGLRSLILLTAPDHAIYRLDNPQFPTGAVQFVVLDDNSQTLGWDQRVIDDPDEVQRLMELLQDGVDPDVRSAGSGQRDTMGRIGFVTDSDHRAMELWKNTRGDLYFCFLDDVNSVWGLTDKATDEIRAYFADHPARDLTDPEEYDAIRLIDPTDGTIYNVREDEFAIVGTALKDAMAAAKSTVGGQVSENIVAEVRVKFFDSGELYIAYERVEGGCKLYVSAQTTKYSPIGMFLEDMTDRGVSVYTLSEKTDPFAAILDQYLDIAGYGD